MMIICDHHMSIIYGRFVKTVRLAGSNLGSNPGPGSGGSVHYDDMLIAAPILVGSAQTAALGVVVRSAGEHGMKEGGALPRNFPRASADTRAIPSSEGHHYREFPRAGAVFVNFSASFRGHARDPVL